MNAFASNMISSTWRGDGLWPKSHLALPDFGTGEGYAMREFRYNGSPSPPILGTGTGWSRIALRPEAEGSVTVSTL